MVETTDVDGLVPHPEFLLVDAFKVFLWSVSACNAGKVAAINITLDEKVSPYINFEEKGLHPEHLEFSTGLKRWVHGLTEGPKKVEELVKSITELAG